MVSKILVGADPELFLKHKITGKMVSAHTLLPGTKLKPFKVANGAIQVDGTAAEFNIDPAGDYPQFVDNITNVINTLKSLVPDYELVMEPVSSFDLDYFKSLPVEVKELGCNPDYNAWTGQVNVTPDADMPFRTASGHIHVGWRDDANTGCESHREDCHLVAKQLDYYLGIWSLFWDPDPRRRSLYGKAGALRYKSYGCEYRTLSNKWLKNRKLQAFVFNRTASAVNDLSTKSYSMEDKYGNFAQRVIDEGIVDWYNTTEGKEICGEFGGRPEEFVKWMQQTAA